MKNQPIINGVRFMKKGVKDATGKYFPCYYSLGYRYLTPGSRETRMALDVNAKEHCGDLPGELNPRNDTDTQTDHFDRDRVSFDAGTPEFEALKTLAYNFAEYGSKPATLTI